MPSDPYFFYFIVNYCIFATNHQRSVTKAWQSCTAFWTGLLCTVSKVINSLNCLCSSEMHKCRPEVFQYANRWDLLACNSLGNKNEMCESLLWKLQQWRAIHLRHFVLNNYISTFFRFWVLFLFFLSSNQVMYVFEEAQHVEFWVERCMFKPGRGYCDVLLGKLLNFHRASLHQKKTFFPPSKKSNHNFNEL